MARPLLVIALLLAVAAAAQAPAGQLTRPPTLLEQVDAVFPPEAADAGVGATVGLEVDLGPDGLVLDARVVQSGGPAFDAAALVALRQFVFTPAEVDSAPAAVRIHYDYTFAVAPLAAAQPDALDAGPVVNFAGVLKRAGTREPVAFAQVVVGEGDQAREVTADEQGHFVVEAVPLGSTRVAVTAAGLERFVATEDIKPKERTEVVYFLQSTDGALTTVVHGERDRREVAQVKLSQAEVKYVAGAHGDAFRVVQNLPGVARSPFGAGLLVVRGSKGWDSRTYVDEVQIPQLFHFAGLTATFNSAVLDGISFQPGNFGADFGRSIGGLVQAEVRTPSQGGLHGYLDVSFFDASALVEAPVGSDWSVSASARRGLADFTVPFALKTFAPQASASVAFSVAPRFWDYQVRIEHKRRSSQNRFFVALYGSSDAYSFISPNPFVDLEAEGLQGNYGNSVTYHRLTVGLDQRLSPRVSLVSRNSVGFDHTEQLGGTTDIFFRNTQVPLQLRERFKIDVPEANLVLSTGLDLVVAPTVLDAQSPPAFKANQIPDLDVQRRLQAEKSTTTYVEPGLFLEAAWSPLQSLKVLGGVRVDYESHMKDAWVDPRLSVLFTPASFLTLKGGVGIYHQPPDYRSGQLSPVFGNPDLKPEGARHYMVGAEGHLGDAVSVDLQLYYKDLFDQARQVLASGIGSDVNIPGADSRYSSAGYGRSYGAELLVRVKPTRNFFGWVAYSLSRFERDYYGGVVYAPGPLDQPHNLIVVASYRLPFDFVFGGRFRWSSGPLVTPIVASLYDTNGNYYYPLPGLPWSTRLPDFLQLDLRLDKRFVFDDWVLAVYFDVQNVTNRQNPEGQFYNFDYTQKAYVNSIPIVPVLGVRGEF